MVARIGSSSFLEPGSLFALVVPLMIFTSVLTADPSDPENYLISMLANLFALGILVAPVLLLRSVWQKRFPELVLPVWLVLLVATSLSFIKAFLTVIAVAELSQLTLQELNLGSRLVAGTISGSAALITASVSVMLLREFQAERALLLSAKTMHSIPMVTASESKKLAQLARGIKSVSVGLQGKAGTPKMELSILRELVDDYVRPLSSSLYADLERNYQSFSARELLRSALQQNPPALALGLQYLFAIPQNIQWFGLEAGLLLGLLGSLLIYSVVFLAGRLVAKVRLAGAISFFLLSTVLPLGVVLGLASILSPGHIYTIATTVAMLLWFSQASVIFAMAKVALRSAVRNRREVSELVQVGDADAAIALLRRNRKLMANQMHGEVQSRLMNLVLRAEAGAELERNVVIQELGAITNLIESVSPKKISLEESLAELQQTWAGFADLEIDLSGLQVPETKQELVFALIEEGVSNAVRHGLANQILVSYQDPNFLVVEDNGMGPISGKPGLGSKLITAGSSSWSLNALDDGGSKLLVELKLN